MLIGGCVWDVISKSDGSFVTCSADHTIRFWKMTSNIVECTKLLVLADSTEALKLQNTSELGESLLLGDEGIRCISLSPDERHLASGDRNGNLRVHELESFSCISSFPAHNSEILTLDFSHSSDSKNPQLLASGSRDRYLVQLKLNLFF